MRHFIGFLTIVFTFLFVGNLQAQNIEGTTLKVFVDCRTDCDLNYFRTKMPLVDYVRDQGLADVHVLINSLSTASGGRKYTLQFFKQNDFSEAPVQEVIFDTPPNATQDDVRSKMVNKFTLGLVPYLMNTPAADLLVINGPEASDNEEGDANSIQTEFDPWNYWVFETGFDIDANYQDQRNRLNLRTDFDVTRITDDLRISAFFYYRNNRQKFIQDEGDIISSLSRYGVFSRVIKSINDHWSIGSFQSVSHSNFENIDLSITAGPAIEYSIFPYEDAIYKEFTIAYYTRINQRSYLEETIYGKTKEFLWDQRLQLALRLRKPWGSVRSELSARHFFQDFSKNSVRFNNNVNVRLFKGLSARFNMDFEFINDQLSLPRGEVSLEDLLLAQRQLATNYEFSFSVGLNYTFGSIYNNIINTRL